MVAKFFSEKSLGCLQQDKLFFINKYHGYM